MNTNLLGGKPMEVPTDSFQALNERVVPLVPRATRPVLDEETRRRIWLEIMGAPPPPPGAARRSARSRRTGRHLYLIDGEGRPS